MDQTNRFAICVTQGDDTDLLKVYPVLDDNDAEETGMLRIIDESGEDYLHASTRFIVVTLPVTEARTLLHSMEIPVTSHN